MHRRPFHASILLLLLLAGTWATTRARESQTANLRGRLLPDDIPGGPLDQAAECLAGTTVELTRSRVSTFGGSATLTWETTLAPDCPAIQLYLNGQVVPLSGSRVVTPQVTSRYTLSGQLLGVRAPSMASTVVVAGRVVAYDVSQDGAPTPSAQPEQSVAYDAAVDQSREIIESLTEPSQSQLIGKVIEVHLIPGDDQYVALTDLPPYRAQEGQQSQEGDRELKCLRGVGGDLRGQSTIVMAIGEETLEQTAKRGDALPWSGCDGGTNPPPLGFIFAHELGHVVRDFALTAEMETALHEAYTSQKEDGGPWLGGDVAKHADYVSRNDGEYFAEGTAAYFEYAWDTRFANDYTPEWIFDNDRDLYDLLASVYGGKVVIIE